MTETETFDILNENSYNEIQVTLFDTGGEEVPQLGIGEDKTGVFVVDLNPDTGISIRKKLYVTPGMRIMDVVKAGIRSGVFEEWSSDDIRLKTCEDLQGEWDEFYNRILGSEKKNVDLAGENFDTDCE